MKYPTVRFLYNRRCTATDVTPASIEIEIAFDKKRKRSSTGIAVLPSQWDESRHVINHPDATELNLRLETFKKPITDYITKLMLEGQPFSFSRFELEMEKKTKAVSFVEYVANKIESRTDIKESTRSSHRRLNGALAAFKRIRTFDDLHPQMMRKFDSWLHDQGHTQATVAVYHRIMKCYINLAVVDGLYDDNPYLGFRIDKGRHKERQYLTEVEISRIRGVKSREKMIKTARDLFIFQCYTGLAYADMMKFDFSLAKEVEGKYIIRDVRQKTSHAFNLVLLSPAVEILNKYKFKLPKVSNQKYNAALKVVGAFAGISISLTSHVARHSFACYCLNKGVPIEVIAAMMGHTDIKTTQIYARMVNKTVERAFDMLEQNL